MHRMFADWYARVHLDADPEHLQRRWNAVEKLYQSADADIALDMVGIFYGTPSVSVEERRNRIFNVFKEADPSFPVHDNQELVRILVGCCVAECASNSTAIGLVVGQAMATARCFGLEQMPEPEDILHQVTAAHQERGQRERSKSINETRLTPRFTKIGPAVGLGQAAIKPVQTNQWPIIQGNFSNLSGHISKLQAEIIKIHNSLTTLREDTRKAVKQLNVQPQSETIAVLKEETEVLWWLFAEHSTELNLPFGKLPRLGASLILAKELADRTSILPAPPSADAFLAKSLNAADDECSLAAVVSATPADWRQTLPHEDELGPLTPVLSAIAKSCEVDGSEWHAAFRKRCAIEPDRVASVHEWARQLYDELLLLKAIDYAKT